MKYPANRFSLAALFFASATAAFGQYQAYDLGTLGGSSSTAYGINNQGTIVGISNTPGGAQHAFSYQNGVMSDLGTLGGSFSTAHSINDAGTIVGWANLPGDNVYHAFSCQNGVMKDLGTLGGDSSYATGINDQGMIVGFSGLTGNPTNLTVPLYHAFGYYNGTINDLGTLGGFSSAAGINIQGAVVGSTATGLNTPPNAFVFQNGVMSNLGTLGGNISQAFGINDQGRVVGLSNVAYGAPNHAFSYANGIMADLGTLGGDVSIAYSINNNAEIVGFSNVVPGGAQHAFSYQNGVMTDLTPYLAAIGMGTGNSIAWAVNDSGEIVGQGSNGHAFLLVPMPAAAPIFSMASGTYAGAQSITITTTIPGFTIRYTTDGSTPTKINGAIYSGPVNINNTTMLKAIADGSSFVDSPVTSGLYTISSASAPVLNVLHDFTGADGFEPEGVLVQGIDSNFYGVTYAGGIKSEGTIFTLSPAGILTTLISLSGANVSPVGLIQGSDGNFYGMTDGTTSGENHSYGTIFRLSPEGILTTLVAFNDPNSEVYPVGALLQGNDGNFYGVTEFGGNTGNGTIFRLTSAGNLVTMVAFNGADGTMPEGGLIQGNDGNFYGTTRFGGAANEGTIFRMTPAGSLTTLVSFTGPNGAQPTGSLVQGADGNFYGTTVNGGITTNVGTVFKMTPSGTLTTLVILTGFSSGNYPLGPLVQGSDGNFYGVTSTTVFKMTPGGTLTTLAAFNGANGDEPSAGLIRGSDGNFYGTTLFGGALGYGVIFQLIPALPLPPQVAAPAFTPAAGTYTGVQTVTISTLTSGASIRYTTDDSTPSENNGSIYSGSPITIGTTTTLQAIAYESGFTDSAVTTATYTISLPPASVPTFNPVAGTYNNDLSVTITSATSGASINYTTDGSTPTETHGTPYTGSPVLINASTTLQAIAFGNGYTDSSVSIAPYTMMVAPVAFSPPSGTYSAVQSVTLSTATIGATIRYTTDGSTPTETNGTTYSGPVTISSTTTLQAIAYETGFVDSAVTSAIYTINLPPAGAPDFSPPAGTYASVQSVTITSSTIGAMIVYTTDGSTPAFNRNNSTVYSGPVSISSTTMLKAIAYAPGFTDSAVTSGLYMITSSAVPGLNVRYDFTSANNGGINPDVLVQGNDGNFYGTTVHGGNANLGTIFKITSTGVLTTLVSFNGVNGSGPSTLIQGSDGNFFGTTRFGGSFNDGTIFMITPTGVLTTLVSFTGANGAQPVAALVQGSDGNFYGTTDWGGSANLGTAFKVTPDGILTTFGSFNGTNGGNPVASLVQGRDGNFYGTTLGAGSGTIFKMTPAGALTTLVSFSGGMGAYPYAGLVQGSDGNFYGTTLAGGSGGAGTVFKVTPAGVLTTLVSFNGANGASPEADLMRGGDGNFYGTTSSGGSSNDGTAFKMTPAGVLTTLVSFDGANGENPLKRLVQGSDGNFYGAALNGGINNSGVIFQLILPQAAAPTFNPIAGTYSNDQSVAIASATPGVSINYTTDGSTPTETNGISYTGGSIVINASTTLQAIAFGNGLTDSPVSTAPYTLVVAPVTFSPAAGTYSSIQSVMLNTVTDSATIVYTTDGSVPSETNGTIYTGGAVAIDATTTLQAAAYKVGYSDSPVASAAYTVNLPTVSTPVFTPLPGLYTSSQSIAINCVTPDVTIRYTTDGSPPSEIDGMLYSGPVTVGANTILYAIAYKDGYLDSDVSNAAYTVIMGGPVVFESENLSPIGTGATVSIANDVNASGGVIEFLNATATGQSMTLTTPVLGAGTYQVQFRYKTNPNRGKHTVKIDGIQVGGTIDQYSTTQAYVTTVLGNITFGSAGTHTILLTVTGKNAASSQYYITADSLNFVPQNLQTVAPPVFSPSGGTFTSGQTVKITATSGTSIRYTTDGSTPTESNGALYSGPVNIGGTTMLKAIAYKLGAVDSSVTKAFYTVTNSPAATLNVLCDFNPNNNGPTHSTAALVQGSDGSFYGTTTNGGSDFDDGTVFKMTPTGALTVLVAFNGANGAAPGSSLVQSSDGNFYGTTTGGGSNNCGTVFRITPAGFLTALVSFNGVNGSAPVAGLVQGSDGNFYATTFYGGNSNLGTVFKMTPAGVLTTLVSFNGTNGAYPTATLVQGHDGNFYGTTGNGGLNDNGTIFKMTPAGTLTTLVLFDGINGTNPYGGLVQGSDGNFYGTTATTVFKMTPAGGLTVLATFNGANGIDSFATLVLGKDGNFYGTTEFGGSSNNGTVFKLTTAGVLTSLASFDGANGDQPSAALIKGNDGNLYGTTNNGGSSGYGVIFQLIPPPPSAAAPVFSPGGGTYTSTQNVTITSATSGASIRYTTDGSMPSETHGTLYSGSSLAISTTTTLQAIAYKAGCSDSTVASTVYTIKPTLNLEAESLSFTGSGATASVQTDTNSSGGKWVELASNSVGNYINFTVPNVPAGTYQLKMEWKGNNARGILQLSVDGANLGSALDQYSSGQTYPTTTFGNITFKASGNHTIRLTVTGKNKSSSSEILSADKFTLIGQ